MNIKIGNKEYGLINTGIINDKLKLSFSHTDGKTSDVQVIFIELTDLLDPKKIGVEMKKQMKARFTEMKKSKEFEIAMLDKKIAEL